jgi:AcrR family transcriptional regulator
MASRQADSRSHEVDPAGAGDGEPVVLSRHEEHLEDTRNGIVEAARELFATQGYADTSIEEIVARARLTKGAMYHHFGSKEEVFRVVLDRVESDFITRLAEAGAPGEDVWEAITNGVQAFLDVALEPEIQQIVLLDGPAVLGWKEWRAVEERYGFGLLRKFLSRAMEAGFLPAQPVEPMVHLLAGALNGGAMAIANATDRRRARTEVGDAVAWVLGSLGQRQPQARRAGSDLAAAIKASPT